MTADEYEERVQGLVKALGMLGPLHYERIAREVLFEVMTTKSLLLALVKRCREMDTVIDSSGYDPVLPGQWAKVTDAVRTRVLWRKAVAEAESLINPPEAS